MICRSCIVAAALGLWGTALAQPEDPGLYLFEIPTTHSAANTADFGQALQVDLHVPNPDRLVERLGGTTLSIVALEKELVRINASPHETLTGPPLPNHQVASFVIDFDEAPVESLVEALLSANGHEPSMDALIEFVYHEIAHKTYRRGFDLASQAAISREGDCTEHAVLLAALARATGRPARVVLGIMLVQSPANLLSLGHAWTEIHDGEHWRIADATRPEVQLPGARARYVPLMELGNEGPGYAMELLTLIRVFPDRIATNQPAEAAKLVTP